MTEAVVAFASDSFVTRNLRYSEKLAWHWILQVAAASAVLLGFLSIYIHKNNNNYEHFKSTHASMGLNTMIMMAGVSTGGLFVSVNKYMYSNNLNSNDDNRIDRFRRQNTHRNSEQ